MLTKNHNGLTAHHHGDDQAFCHGLEQDLWQNLTAQNLSDVSKALARRDLKSEIVRIALQAVKCRRNDISILAMAAHLIRNYTHRFDIVEALQAYALQLDPNNRDMAIAYAQTLIMDKKLSQGLVVFENLLKSFPQSWIVAGVCVGQALIENGYYHPALRILFSLEEKVDDKKGILCDLIGVTLGALNRSDQALKWYQKAIGRDNASQKFKQNYALSLLKSGDYEKGWSLWQHRHYQCLSPFRVLCNLPHLGRATTLEGQHIALYQEQGLGDTLQFIRFLPWLMRQNVTVTLCVVPILQSLFAYSFPDVKQCAMDEIAKCATRCDYSLAIPDLPYIYGLKNIKDVPKINPYLHVPVQNVEHFAHLLPTKKPRIGVCWAGGHRPESKTLMVDRRRSIPFEQFMEAITPIDASIINLQYEKSEELLRTWKGQQIVNPMVEVHNFMDSASILFNLDLVISVDTSIAHLAGALGHCPVWIIGRRDGCWRWGDRGRRTPWYSQARIFRPQEEGFSVILKELKKALHQWVRNFDRRGET